MKKRLASIAAAVGLVAVAVPATANAQDAAAPEDGSIAAIAAADGRFGTLLTAATAAGLAEGLGSCASDPVTVFAPTDAAFEAVPEDLLTAALGDPDGLLTEILTYHVLEGDVLAADVLAADSLTTLQGGTLTPDAGPPPTLNGDVEIIATDIDACNGTIHVIDAVLVPALPSIATIATDGGFTTLVAALDAAGLVPTFADCAAGPFTVFAPTDAAFAAALEALDLSAEDLLGNTDLLTTVLEYHVVPGIVGSAEVLESTSLETLQGESIAVNGTQLNGSVNIQADAVDNWACNGVVHVIDGVLLPPSLTPEPTVPTTVPTPTTPPGGDLPPTGNNSVLALVAGMLVLAGGGLLLARRRPTA